MTSRPKSQCFETAHTVQWCLIMLMRHHCKMMTSPCFSPTGALVPDLYSGQTDGKNYNRWHETTMSWWVRLCGDLWFGAQSQSVKLKLGGGMKHKFLKVLAPSPLYNQPKCPSRVHKPDIAPLFDKQTYIGFPSTSTIVRCFFRSACLTSISLSSVEMASRLGGRKRKTTNALILLY